MNPKNIKNVNSTREIRAKRLKILRNMAGLTRKCCNDHYGISSGNFQNWEGPRFGGLTEEGAEKMLYACKEAGVEATLEWLMYGAGPSPYVTEEFYNKKSKKITNASIANEEHMITGELESFKQNHQQQVLDIVIKDDGMYPQYKMGDIIAGKRCTDASILRFINTDCIIELKDGGLILRNLQAGNKNKLYNLVCSNPSPTIAKQTITNVAISSVAPIMWIRRKFPL